MTDGRTKAVGGIRLANKPLHLGHFVGTFAAHAASGCVDPLVYVIKDTEPYRWNSPEEKVKWIVRLSKAAMIVAAPAEIEVVVASALLKQAWALQCVLADCIGYRRLVCCHFQKDAIRSGTYQGRVKHFLFPFEEAIVFTFLQAEVFFSNLDNERIINYVRDCQKRLDKHLGRIRPLVRTHIRSYPNLPFLPGEDYNRMSSNNRNGVPIDATDGRLLELAENAVKLRRYLSFRPDLLAQWESNGEVRLEDDFLAAILMRVFGHTQIFEEHRVQRMGRETVAELQESLHRLLLTRVGVWRERLAASSLKDRDVFDMVVSNGERLARKHGGLWDEMLD